MWQKSCSNKLFIYKMNCTMGLLQDRLDENATWCGQWAHLWICMCDMHYCIKSRFTFLSISIGKQICSILNWQYLHIGKGQYWHIGISAYRQKCGIILSLMVDCNLSTRETFGGMNKSASSCKGAVSLCYHATTTRFLTLKMMTNYRGPFCRRLSCNGPWLQ